MSFVYTWSNRSKFDTTREFIHSPVMASTIKQTTMTLSERFRILRAQELSREQSSLVVNGNNTGPVRGSLRNQKYANQLATRPAVQAALRLKNRSIKQRLGIKASGRLGPPVSSYDSYEYAPLLAMDQVATPFVRSSYINTSPFPKNRFNGWRRFGDSSFRPYFGQRLVEHIVEVNDSIMVVYRRFPFQPRHINDGFKWVNPKFARRGFKKNPFGGNRRFRRGNPSGPKFWQRRRKPNKEQLDNDLDQYMAKTRNSLNAELDAYMAQINP